jgi:MFS family permease
MIITLYTLNRNSHSFLHIAIKLTYIHSISYGTKSIYILILNYISLEMKVPLFIMQKIFYGWIILLLSFLALLSVQGIRSSFGAFIEPWESEFLTSRGTISSIALLSFIVYGASQPMIGYVIDSWGVRKVLSFSTLLVGLSTCLIFYVTSFWQLVASRPWWVGSMKSVIGCSYVVFSRWRFGCRGHRYRHIWPAPVKAVAVGEAQSAGL